MKNQRAFTLIEVMVVTGIVALLAGTVIVTINPSKRFEEARNKQREIHVQAILSAVETRLITEKGWPQDPSPPGCYALPQETEIDPETGSEVPVFKTIGTTADPNNYYDLYSCIIPKYLDKPLFDPLGGSEADTHYQIWQNPYTKRVTVLFIKENTVIAAGPETYTVVKKPTVKTYDATGIAFDRATLNGEVIDDGGSFVFERGFAWCSGSSCEPTLAGSYAVVGSGTGVFSHEITGLQADTAYNYKAWAKNDVGLSYGSSTRFFTDTGKPIVETVPVGNNFGGDWAYLCGNLVSPGVSTPTKWISWGDTQAMANSLFAPFDYDEGATGNYCSYVNLSGNTTYYFRAEAQNTQGSSAGNMEQFTTPPAGKPLVKNTSFANVTYFSADISGFVEKSGGAALTDVGACYSKTGPPGPTDTCWWEGTTQTPPFSFTVTPTDLDPGALYYVRACAKNTSGDPVGCDIDYVTFTTDKAPQNPPASVSLDPLIYGQDGFATWDQVITADQYRIDVYVDNVLTASSTTPATSSFISSQNYQAGQSVYVKVRAEETATHLASAYTQSNTQIVAKADQSAPLWVNLQGPLRYDQNATLDWAIVDGAEAYDVEIYKNGVLATSDQVLNPPYTIPGEMPGGIFQVGDVIKGQVRAAESQNYNPSSWKISAEKTVQKGLQDVEITDVQWQSLVDTTSATVTANLAVEGTQEYRVREEGGSWSSWQISNVFGNLAPAATHDFQSHVGETANYEAATSTIFTSKSPKAYQTIDNIAAVDHIALICHVDSTVQMPQPGTGADDYRYRTTGGTWSGWQTSNVFSGLTGNTSYEFQARKQETATHFEATSDAFLTTTPRANQPTPANPTVPTKTWQSAKVEGDAGTEVSLDQTNWFTSPHTFSGLTTDTLYTAYARYPQTSTHNASAVSTTDFIIPSAVVNVDIATSTGP